MGGMIHVAPDASGLDADGFGGGIHPNTFHSRQVDHQAAVTGSQAGAVVAAAADRRQQVIFPAKIHGRDHVGHVHATRNQTRALIDHAVVDFARRLISGVRGLDKLSRKEPFN